MSLRANLQAPAQADLFAPEGKFQREYEEHRRKHPEVFAAFVSIARGVQSEGWQRCSPRMVWELLRHQLGPRIQKDAQGFALNDHLTKWYAKAAMEEHPDLAGIFETRGRA